MRCVIVLLALLLSCQETRAGAWTQPDGKWQVITNLILSNADRSFDSHGDGGAPVTFRRTLLQTTTDYGWNDHLTLYGRVESAYAHFRDAFTPPVTAMNTALEAGARLRVMNDEALGILSLEGALRSAGAFNFAVSANSLASGRSAGLRVLYGKSFRWAGMDGFVDVQTGQTFLSRPRPNQTPFDLTAGIWIDDKTMGMIQSFNLVGAGGGGGASYPYFRSHKLEVSVVRKLSARYSICSGAFFSPVGQNALVEQGLCLALWANF